MPEIATQTPDWMFRCQDCGETTFDPQWEENVKRSEALEEEHAVKVARDRSEWDLRMAEIDADNARRFANPSKRKLLPRPKPRFEHSF